MPLQPRTRRSYHTDLKLAAFHGLLPQPLAQAIPKSTLHGFRQSNPSHHLGIEYAQFLDQISVFKELAQCKTALSTAHAVLRLSHLLRSLAVRADQIKRIKIPELRTRIVQTLTRLRETLPLKKLLGYLKLSAARFASWSRNASKCLGSPLALCRKHYPNQLTAAEVKTIKKTFSDPQLRHWPRSSIAWKMIHEGLLCAHFRTIIAYAKKLGLAARAPFHRSRKRGSLSAQAPNQAWHCDATVVTTLDNRKGYAQLLIDNFSRKILAWKVSSTISGLSTAEVLKQAFASLAQVPQAQISLIVDGGSENNNSTVEAFLSDRPVRKLVARVDVSFSNSLIEAVNKILKYQYLFRKPIPDLEHLKSVIDESIRDYNERPHCALNGLSPNQAYEGKLFDKGGYHERIVRAAENRRLINRAACPPCVPLDWDREEGERNEA